MAAVLTLRNDERIGLGVAVIAHIALLVALSVQVSRSPAIIAPPERMVVSLAEDIAMTASAPVISEQTQAALAPEISDRPNPKPPSDANAPAEDRPTPRVNPRTRTEQRQPQPRNQERATGAEFGSAFREGQSSGERNQGGAPAEAISPRVVSSIQMSIVRQLRPNWNAPDGLDAELLSTEVTWRMNRDGSINGQPRCETTTGVTASNRPQASRHCELAIRAIRKTAPFNLPDQYYAAWQEVTSTFNKELSQ